MVVTICNKQATACFEKAVIGISVRPYTFQILHEFVSFWGHPVVLSVQPNSASGNLPERTSEYSTIQMCQGCGIIPKKMEACNCCQMLLN